MQRHSLIGRFEQGTYEWLEKSGFWLSIFFHVLGYEDFFMGFLMIPLQPKGIPSRIVQHTFNKITPQVLLRFFKRLFEKIPSPSVDYLDSSVELAINSFYILGYNIFMNSSSNCTPEIHSLIPLKNVVMIFL